MELQLKCRFTDRYLVVKPHGHGVKLTIRVNEDQGVERWRSRSVFLDQADIEALARELASFDAPLQATADRNRALETVELALFMLGDAVEKARKAIASAL